MDLSCIILSDTCPGCNIGLDMDPQHIEGSYFTWFDIRLDQIMLYLGESLILGVVLFESCLD